MLDREEWKHISSAPRDGTWVLARRRAASNLKHPEVVVRWNEKSKTWISRHGQNIWVKGPDALFDGWKETDQGEGRQGWKPEEDARLRMLIGQRMRYTHIADKLQRTPSSVAARCRELGITRNSVDPISTTNGQLMGVHSWGKKRQEIGNSIVDLKPEPLPATAVFITDLTSDHCRWPFSGFMSCGERVEITSVYCEKHAMRAYNPQIKK